MTKQTMQQALEMLEKGGLNCEQEEFVLKTLRKSIADSEQDVGLLKIVLEQKAARLKSCEIALAERDASLEEYKQAEKQEPVGRKLTEAEMGIGFDRKCGTVVWVKSVPEGSNLYTHPAPKSKKLTEDDIFDIADVHPMFGNISGDCVASFARDIEAKVLGEDV